MRPHSLPILGGFFLCAFVGRAIVLAAEASEGSLAQVGSAAPGSSCLTGPLAEELKANIDALEERRVELAEREGYAAAVKAKAELRIQELESLNTALGERLKTAGDARAAEVRRVAAIYEKMKPALASAIFAKMDARFAAGLLLEMNEETASAILAGLESDRAYSITVLMARRAMNAGDDL